MKLIYLIYIFALVGCNRNQEAPTSSRVQAVIDDKRDHESELTENQVATIAIDEVARRTSTPAGTLHGEALFDQGAWSIAVRPQKARPGDFWFVRVSKEGKSLEVGAGE